MSTEINQLMGEIIENPDGQVKDIEQLLSGFLGAMLKEQAPRTQKATSETPPAVGEKEDSKK